MALYREVRATTSSKEWTDLDALNRFAREKPLR